MTSTLHVLRVSDLSSMVEAVFVSERTYLLPVVGFLSDLLQAHISAST